MYAIYRATLFLQAPQHVACLKPTRSVSYRRHGSPLATYWGLSVTRQHGHSATATDRVGSRCDVVAGTAATTTKSIQIVGVVSVWCRRGTCLVPAATAARSLRPCSEDSAS